MSTKTKTASTGKEYRFVGPHATEFAMDSGAKMQVGPGDFIELTESEMNAHPEHQEWLMDVAAVVPTKEELEAFKESQAIEASEGEATTTTEEVTTSDAG